MKKLSYLLFLLISLFSLNIVYANDIKDIVMNIYVDSSGDAHVVEKWIANVSNGTEGYKPYYNLGNSEILNYQVSMNGNKFTTLDYWDIDASFNEKSNKAGINEISDGVELCYGITNYGTNTYTMTYTITNFVSTTNDSDMIYWTLIPYDLSDKPESVYISIYGDFTCTNDIPVWGYGY